MPRHSLWCRALAAVIAPWFAIVMAEPAALHTCAVHSGATAAAATAPGSATHTQAAHQHAAANTGGDGHTPAAPHHGGNQCSCLGGCCAASPVSIDASALLSWVPAEVLRERPLAATDEIRAAAAEHLLPFANGPPSRA